MDRLPHLAVLIQHPRSPVVFTVPPADPREQAVLPPEDRPTPQQVRAAWLESNRERAKLNIPPHPRPLHDNERDEQLERCAAIDTLSDMVDRYGPECVFRWARFAANLRGYEV